MNYPHRTPLPSAVACMALLGVVAGCGNSADAPLDMGSLDLGQPDLPPIIDMGDDYGPPVRYRITELHIPTVTEGAADVRVGHDVDGVYVACGVPDYAFAVDNSLIDLNAQLTPPMPPAGRFDLQGAIDTALLCAPDAPPSECTRLDLILSVASGTGRARIEVERGDGSTLTGAVVGSLNANGDLRAALPQLDLVIPYHVEGGAVSIQLDMTNVVVSANIGTNALTSFVLGGVVERGAFEAMLMAALSQVGDDPTFAEIELALDILYDVMLGGVCSGLSVGFTGSATLAEAP